MHLVKFKKYSKRQRKYSNTLMTSLLSNQGETNLNMGNKIFEVYQNIKSTLQAETIKVSDYKSIDYGLQFTVSILDWSGLIRIYQNKKGGLKIDYSQLKGGANATKPFLVVRFKIVKDIPYFFLYIVFSCNYKFRSVSLGKKF